MLKVVGMGELGVSADAGDTLVTYALGTCVGISAHDAKTGAGGLLHFMLPESALNPERARRQPGMFADTGLAVLLGRLQMLGASPKRLVLKLAGGSEPSEPESSFDIGRRNLLAARRLLWKHGLGLSAEDSGGKMVRTLRLEIATGRVLLKGSPLGEAF